MIQCSQSNYIQRELNYASFMGFCRQGAKQGGKAALFSGLFIGTSLILDRYRGRKYDALNTVASGALTAALFSLYSECIHAYVYFYIYRAYNVTCFLYIFTLF